MKTILPLLLCVNFLIAHNPVAQSYPDRRVRDQMFRINSLYNISLPSGFNLEPLPHGSEADFFDRALRSGRLSLVDAAQAADIYERLTGRLFERESDAGSIGLNITLKGETTLRLHDSTGTRAIGTIAPKVEGSFGGINFSSAFFVSTEFDSDSSWIKSNYEPYNGIPYNLFNREDSGSLRTHDILRSRMAWNLNRTEMEIGLDHLRAGPTKRGPLMLNSSAAPITYFRMAMDFQFFRYTHLTGLLRIFKNENKYLHYHRLDLPLAGGRVVVGFSESIVYGAIPDRAYSMNIDKDLLDPYFYDTDRSIEPAYLIPFIPFAFTEHYTGDKDNVQIGFDISLYAFPPFRWYFEWMLDDISNPLTMFSDDFGNKWSLTLGGEWYGMINSRGLTIGGEYTRVEPWVYTHFRGASNNYSHYGASLGAPLGPNSAQAYLWASLLLSEKHSFQLEYSNHRFDQNYRGGDLYHVFIDTANAQRIYDRLGERVDADSEKKVFLENPEKHNRFSLQWSFRSFQFYEMRSRFSLISREEPYGSRENWPQLDLIGVFNF